MTLATEPQGAVLSAAADQTRSGGHMKAAGPMVSEAPIAPAASARIDIDRNEIILPVTSGIVGVMGWMRNADR